MTTSEPIKVLLVDDHPVVRDGLASMISLEDDMIVSGSAATGAEVLRMFDERKPDVMVVDLILPDMSGIEVTRKIAAKSHDVQVIILTGSSGDEDIYRAMEAGARGYLFKDTARRELIQAIRAVHGGRQFIAPEVGRCLAEAFPRSDLSAREIEVLKLVAVGRKNKEVAFELLISETTVNVHVKHIMQKLNAADRTEAVTTAMRRGIIRL
ncbi:MAG TPA: response regulator transcription factor [Bryobacteraceae bacterium]